MKFVKKVKPYFFFYKKVIQIKKKIKFFNFKTFLFELQKFKKDKNSKKSILKKNKKKYVRKNLIFSFKFKNFKFNTFKKKKKYFIKNLYLSFFYKKLFKCKLLKNIFIYLKQLKKINKKTKIFFSNKKLDKMELKLKNKFTLYVKNQLFKKKIKRTFKTIKLTSKRVLGLIFKKKNFFFRDFFYKKRFFKFGYPIKGYKKRVPLQRVSNFIVDFKLLKIHMISENFYNKKRQSINLLPFKTKNIQNLIGFARVRSLSKRMFNKDNNIYIRNSFSSRFKYNVHKKYFKKNNEITKIQ